MTDEPTTGGVSEERVSTALRDVFGFSEFRPNQREIVEAILSGRDVFAVMPTGGGKSLCYQLPACVLPGTCVVVSPLISLMKDQVDGAAASGIRAEFLNSSLDAVQRREVRRSLRSGELDLLYVSPERLAMDGFLETLRQTCLSLFAIDEAHCISEWGHQFRPDYLTLDRIIPAFPDVPVAAFTATATRRVQTDVIERLGLRDPLEVRASFNRPNLFYEVRKRGDLYAQLAEFLRQRPNDGGIIYRTTRKDVEETASVLRGLGVEARPYHAGLDRSERHEAQEAFNRDQARVIVATIAFGMGIDKSNVRFVVHGDLPKNIEGYYQETGRAGRDGEPAHCLLLFERSDAQRLRYFIDQIEDDTQREAASTRLREMVRYGSLSACRRGQLLRYFGEPPAADNCGGCDVCTSDLQKVESTEHAQMLLSAVIRTGERFGAGHVVDIVTGADTERVRKLSHDRLPTHGVGKGRAKKYWRDLVDELVAQGCLSRSDGQYPTLGLTDLGRDVLFGRREFHVLRKRKAKKVGTRKAARQGAKSRKAQAARPSEAVEEFTYAYEAELFEVLRGLRAELAAQQGVPPYIVFSDRTLREMARELPINTQELRGITGVGQVKLERYGEAFLGAIRGFRPDASSSPSGERTDGEP